MLKNKFSASECQRRNNPVVLNMNLPGGQAIKTGEHVAAYRPEGEHYWPQGYEIASTVRQETTSTHSIKQTMLVLSIAQQLTRSCLEDRVASSQDCGYEHNPVCSTLSFIYVLCSNVL